MAKRSNRQTLLLPDVLWNDLAIVAAHEGISRAELIRDTLQATVDCNKPLGPSHTRLTVPPIIASNGIDDDEPTI